MNYQNLENAVNEIGELKKVSKMTIKVGVDYAAKYKAATGNDFVPSNKPSVYEFINKEFLPAKQPR